MTAISKCTYLRTFMYEMIFTKTKTFGRELTALDTILSDGHFTFKNNDILESDRFLYRINIFNGRWLVTVTSLLSNIYKSRIIYSYTLQWGFLILI